MSEQCEHKNVEINLSATTSVMSIALHIFGFKCEDCEKQWDIGNAVDAIRATERLSSEVAYLAAESFEQTPTAHFPSDYDGVGMALRAYARTLEDKP